MECLWDGDWQANAEVLEKTCPSAFLSTTDPTWTALALNLAFSVRCEWHMAQAVSQPCHCEVTHPCNQIKMFSIFSICYILMYEFQMKVNRLEGILLGCVLEYLTVCCDVWYPQCWKFSFSFDGICHCLVLWMVTDCDIKWYHIPEDCGLNVSLFGKDLVWH